MIGFGGVVCHSKGSELSRPDKNRSESDSELANNARPDQSGRIGLPGKSDGTQKARNAKRTKGANDNVGEQELHRQECLCHSAAGRPERCENGKAAVTL